MDYGDLNPFALEHPLAPELSAADAETEVTLAPILAAHARLAAHADAVIVEGVGGWAAPLSATLMQMDPVRVLRLPVVLVVGLRLGCLNHALLSARGIVGDGVPLIGWPDCRSASQTRVGGLRPRSWLAPVWVETRVVYARVAEPRASHGDGEAAC